LQKSERKAIKAELASIVSEVPEMKLMTPKVFSATLQNIATTHLTKTEPGQYDTTINEFEEFIKIVAGTDKDRMEKLMGIILTQLRQRKGTVSVVRNYRKRVNEYMAQSKWPRAKAEAWITHLESQGQ